MAVKMKCQDSLIKGVPREERWQSNYEALKAHVARTGHFPGKHTRLNNWCRYQRKRIKAGIMPDEQRALFEELAASRGDKGEQVLF